MKNENLSEATLCLEFASIGEAMIRDFPEISGFNDGEIEELRNLIYTFNNLKEKKKFTKHPTITKTIKFVIENKDKLTNTADKEKKSIEMTQLLQRTQANFENYRKQQEKRMKEIQAWANKDLISQLLTVLDNFGLALKTEGGSEEFVKGVDLIHAQLLTILENQGLESIKTENKVFDPSVHEALIKEDSDKPENTVLEELQKGYYLNGKVIRHTKVKISGGGK